MHFFAGHADTGILNRKFDLVRDGIIGYISCNAALLSEFDRIATQVYQDLLQANRVGFNYFWNWKIIINNKFQSRLPGLHARQ